MSKRINWKKVKERESFFLKHGRFPNRSERVSNKGKPTLIFGHNTVSR